MIVHVIHPDGRHKQLHGPRDLDSIEQPARIRITSKTPYDPNWVTALGHAAIRGLTVTTKGPHHG